MWRGVYNEDWERWREITTRALFHDIPILSPVPEEEDSQHGFSVHVSPSSLKAWKPIDDASRPRSPLPPLIIEREPNRHDEPEEYYQQLTRKMKKMYRILFIENRSLETSQSTNGSSYSYARVEVGSSAPLHSSTHTDKHSPDKDQNNETDSFDQAQNKHIKKTFQSSNVELASNGEITNNSHEDIEKDSNSISNITQESPGFSSRDHYLQVTIQAEVHREPSVGDDTSLASDGRVSEDAGNQGDDALLKRTGISDIITRTTPAHLNINEMEVMRTPRDPGTRTSFDTLLQQPHEASSDRVSPEAARHSLEAHNPFDILKDTRESSPTEIEQCSDDFNITLQSSTPKLAKKRPIAAENVSGDYLTPSSHKRIRYDSVATQCYNLTEWSSLRAHFFVGSPKVFKLCSCKDHRCGC